MTPAIITFLNWNTKTGKNSYIVGCCFYFFVYFPLGSSFAKQTNTNNNKLLKLFVGSARYKEIKGKFTCNAVLCLNIFSPGKLIKGKAAAAACAAVFFNLNSEHRSLNLCGLDD